MKFTDVGGSPPRGKGGGKGRGEKEAKKAVEANEEAIVGQMDFKFFWRTKQEKKKLKMKFSISYHL